MEVATITVGIDPTIAFGSVAGGLVSAHEARRRGLDSEPLYMVGVIVVVGALIGGRV
jgi:hypothetical protein